MKRPAFLALAMILSSMDTGPAQAQTILLRQNASTIETLDPHLSTASAESAILREMVEGLVTLGPDGKIIPGMAQSWVMSPDGLVYTFKMRPKATWSNGDSFTANDFVYSLRRIINPATKSKYANMLYPIKNAEAINTKKADVAVEDLGVRAIDDGTLEITLEKPTPYFLALLAHTVGFPVNRGAVEAFGKDFTKPGNYVANGAFILAETPGKNYVLKKNPKYHDAANVKLDGVTFVSEPSPEKAVDLFMKGQLHLVSGVPAQQMMFLREKLGDQFKFTPYLSTYFIIFNHDKPPMNDARVRRALSMVLDRDYLSDQIWMGAMLPAFSVIPPGIDNYVDNPPELDYKMMTQSAREAEARRLLAEAGYDQKTRKLKVTYHFTEIPMERATAEALADIWSQIDIETELVAADTKGHNVKLKETRDFQLARYAWNADYSDPQNFLFLMESKNTGLNFAGNSQPDFDRLMEAAAGEVDIKKRAEILAKAARLADHNHSFAPLMYNTNRFLVSAAVSGFVPNMRGVNASRFLALDPAKAGAPRTTN